MRGGRRPWAILDVLVRPCRLFVPSPPQDLRLARARAKRRIFLSETTYSVSRLRMSRRAHARGEGVRDPLATAPQTLPATLHGREAGRRPAAGKINLAFPLPLEPPISFKPCGLLQISPSSRFGGLALLEGNLLSDRERSQDDEPSTLEPTSTGDPFSFPPPSPAGYEGTGEGLPPYTRSSRSR